MTTYYVTTSGNDANAGTSEAAAFASPGKAAAVATSAGDVVYVKAGTYTLSSSAANASGGPVSLSVGVRLEGYSTTPGDLAGRPVIHAGAITAVSLVVFPYSYSSRPTMAVNIEADGNSGASNVGFDLPNGYNSRLLHCVARNCPSSGFRETGNFETAINCAAYSCGVGFQGFSSTVRCLAQACSGNGFDTTRTILFCIAAGNGGRGFSHGNLNGWTIGNSVAYGNTGDGFGATYDMGVVFGCVAEANSAYGFGFDSSGSNGVLMLHNAHYGNSSGAFRYSVPAQYGTLALSVSPFVDAAGGDFSLNNTAGGGADLRGVSVPDASPAFSGRGYQDIGAYQHQDSGGGSGGGGLLLARGFNGGF